MKLKELAIRLGTNTDSLTNWLKTTKFKYKEGFFGIDIDDGQNIQEIEAAYKQHLSEKAQRAEAEAARRADEKKREQEALDEKRIALASMLITSGFNFEGFTITKYSGYISGDDVIEVNRPTRGWLGSMSSNVGEELMKSLAKMRRNAISELKESAYQLGCNAVIGVDFDYLTLDPETVTPQGGTLYLPFLFGVTANGNAVFIEKNSN
jgi:uncharacterized protein YbjQ (UPF0145 family)